jgi:hypothetical protein
MDVEDVGSSSCVSSYSDASNINDQSDSESYISEYEKSNDLDYFSEQQQIRGRGRGRGRCRGRGRPRGSGHGPIKPPQLIWFKSILELIIHNWEGNQGVIGFSIRSIIEMMPNKWFSIFFTENMISNIVQHTNEYL